MSILHNKKKLLILLFALLPTLCVIGVEAADILGGKKAYAPASYSTDIFIIE
jgi:hypothetical protein